jgi:hypothetical protein
MRSGLGIGTGISDEFYLLPIQTGQSFSNLPHPGPIAKLCSSQSADRRSLCIRPLFIECIPRATKLQGGFYWLVSRPLAIALPTIEIQGSRAKCANRWSAPSRRMAIAGLARMTCAQRSGRSCKTRLQFHSKTNFTVTYVSTSTGSPFSNVGR